MFLIPLTSNENPSTIVSSVDSARGCFPHLAVDSFPSLKCPSINFDFYFPIVSAITFLTTLLHPLSSWPLRVCFSFVLTRISPEITITITNTKHMAQMAAQLDPAMYFAAKVISCEAVMCTLSYNASSYF